MIDHEDVEAIVRAIAAVLLERVEKELAPLRKSIEALEENALRYAGLFSRGMSYARGDLVTHAGSVWYTWRETSGGEAPGEAGSPFVLIAKGGGLAAAAPASIKVMSGGRK